MCLVKTVYLEQARRGEKEDSGSDKHTDIRVKLTDLQGHQSETPWEKGWNGAGGIEISNNMRAYSNPALINGPIRVGLFG
jgi:hypothetical protein